MHQLHDIRETLFAYVVSYGALPCPLDQSSDGLMSTSTAYFDSDTRAAVCTIAQGWLPSSLLGIQGVVNVEGALLDPWGREYRYVVSLMSSADSGQAGLPDWTTPGEAAVVGVDHLRSDITLCNKVTRADCSGRAIRANQIAFVVLSLGADQSADGIQSENQDNDSVFLVTDESVVEGSEFDDLLVWGSAADTMYWMLRMGWLP